jgi:hypothetical protein
LIKELLEEVQPRQLQTYATSAELATQVVLGSEGSAVSFFSWFFLWLFGDVPAEFSVERHRLFSAAIEMV